MNSETIAPAKAYENGKFLISSTDELEFIRRWLPQAPASVFIVRVVHRRNETGEDVFKVACSYPPARSLSGDLRLYDHLMAKWANYVTSLNLPETVSIGDRRVQLRWVPAECDWRTQDELSDEEIVNQELEEEINWAVCIWSVVERNGVDHLADLYGDYEACVDNLLLRPPPMQFWSQRNDRHDGGARAMSAKSPAFSQQVLEKSISEVPDIWFYFLAKAAAEAIASPLVTDFQERLEVWRDSGMVPVLADLAEEFFRHDHERQAEANPEQRRRSATIRTLATTLLDDLLSSRLDEVNELKRLVGC